MHGDFSLNPTAYRDRVSRVLSQQGRVQLDSDANEQTESLLRYLRGLGLDTIGAHGGIGDSFGLVFHPNPKEVLIRWGVYYVDGIRCVNLPDGFDPLTPEAETKEGRSYVLQRDYFVDDEDDGLDEILGEKLVYLDVFERHISAAEDESLREVALMGPDTTSRAVVVWQVRAIDLDTFNDEKAALKAPPAWWAGMGAKTWDDDYRALRMILASGVRMRARAVVTDATDPCTIAPDARYRGTENRLFRVEIHDPGNAASATFKWSEDNASIVYPVRSVEGKTVQLESLGRDERTAIHVNDWVEVVDERVALMGIANPLLQVIAVRHQDMTVELSEEPAGNIGSDVKKHPTILRRWASEPMPIRETPIANVRDGWLELVNGVEIQFSRLPVPKGGYRTGDYWLIPTRTATGDVVWPEVNGVARALPSHGADHHYAPLAVLNMDGITPVEDRRREFEPLAIVVP